MKITVFEEAAKIREDFVKWRKMKIGQIAEAPSFSSIQRGPAAPPSSSSPGSASPPGHSSPTAGPGSNFPSSSSDEPPSKRARH